MWFARHFDCPVAFIASSRLEGWRILPNVVLKVEGTCALTNVAFHFHKVILAFFAILPLAIPMTFTVVKGAECVATVVSVAAHIRVGEHLVALFVIADRSSAAFGSRERASIAAKAAICVRRRRIGALVDLAEFLVLRPSLLLVLC